MGASGNMPSDMVLTSVVTVNEEEHTIALHFTKCVEQEEEKQYNKVSIY